VTDSQIKLALAESVREVLEKMFFVDVLGAAVAGQLRPARIAAEVVFEGDPPGSFRLEMDPAAAASAAADFLGEDPAGLAANQIEEVVCELANMICGSVLSRIESSATFRLSKPEIAGAPESRNAGLTGADFEASLAEGGLRAEIRMERPVCQERGESGY
jgi:CheY-specific phosphatase CheX